MGKNVITDNYIPDQLPKTPKHLINLSHENLADHIKSKLTSHQETFIFQYIIHYKLFEQENLIFLKNHILKNKYFEQFWNEEIPLNFFSQLKIISIKKNEIFLKTNDIHDSMYLIFSGKMYILQNGVVAGKIQYQQFLHQFWSDLNENRFFEKKFQTQFERYQIGDLKLSDFQKAFEKKVFTENQLQVIFMLYNFQDADITQFLKEGLYFEETILQDLRNKSDVSAFCQEDCQLITISQQMYRKYLIQPLKKVSVQLYKVFKKQPFLKDMEMQSLKILAEFSKVAKFNQKEIVCSQNETNEHLFFLLNGSVITLLDNRAVVLIEKNQFFGEESYEKGNVSLLTYRCEEDSLLIKIQFTKFLKCKRVPIISRENLYEQTKLIFIRKQKLRQNLHDSNKEQFTKTFSQNFKLYIPNPIPQNINPQIYKNNINEERFAKKSSQQTFFKNFKLGKETSEIKMPDFNFISNQHLFLQMKRNRIVRYNFLQNTKKQKQINNFTQAPKYEKQNSILKDSSFQDIENNKKSQKDLQKSPSGTSLQNRTVHLLYRKCQYLVLIKLDRPVTYLEKVKDYFVQLKKSGKKDNTNSQSKMKQRQYSGRNPYLNISRKPIFFND